MAHLRIEPFDHAHLDDAAALLADRHRAQRAHEPGLDPRYEDPAATRPEIEALLGLEVASGAAAVRDGRLLGYLVGVVRDQAVWGPNVWVEPAGHAVSEPEVARELYAVAAADWVGAGRTNHHAIVPATDSALVDAWFGLDFGQQHVHAIQETPAADWRPTVGDRITIRLAERRDILALAEIDLALPRHQMESPVFSRLAVPPLDEAVADVEESFGDEQSATFVAELDGTIVGSAVGCPIEQSSMHAGVARPSSSGFLGFAAILPAARGHGVGRALGESVIAWSRDRGYAWVMTDWRSTNLQANRAWRGLGFRPLFRRLHRTIL